MLNGATSIAGRHFYQGLLEALAQAMGTAKGYLFEHGPRTALLAHALGVELSLSEEELSELFFGAVLADIGMIGLVEAAWDEPVPVLPEDARREVQQHPERSAAVASAIPFLEGSELFVRHHHEWWDGTGYPDGLERDDISLGARILRLADTVTALGESRPQRERCSPQEIRETVVRASGTEFDPEIAGLWLDLDRTGMLAAFHHGRYRELRLHAIETLVPEQVPVASSELLLDLFSSLIDAKDPYTGGHSRRVAHLAGGLARAMGLDDLIQGRVRTAGHLHDLGKLSVPSRILRKAAGLDPEENERVRRHAGDGARLLEEIPALRAFATACRHHHERWDGRGYPEGISGERIPLFARILGVCDAYDAMTSARAYRSALTHEQAIGELRAGVGIQFAPQEAEIFLTLPDTLFERSESGEEERFALQPPRPSGSARRNTVVSKARRSTV